MKKILADIHACTLCSDKLPLSPRPVLQVDVQARILLVGQAPGRKVHDSGIPFDDQSGERLRHWMGVNKHVFYDSTQIAIIPMGFCYPGRGKSGDLAPRRECAKQWRQPLLSQLHKVQLTLVIGRYAMAYHLPNATGSLTDTVRNWRDYQPNLIPLPHPSPRNNIWLKRNVWFTQDVLPALQQRVSAILSQN